MYTITVGVGSDELKILVDSPIKFKLRRWRPWLIVRNAKGEAVVVPKRNVAYILVSKNV
jgi:hypothetical protein